MEDNFLKNLKIDHWSTILIAFGVALIVTGLKAEIKVVTNLDLLLIGIGLSFLGFGEKFNYIWITVTTPVNAYVAYPTERYNQTEAPALKPAGVLPSR